MPSITSTSSFPSPTGGASLLLSFRLQRRTILIIGANTLAASRAFVALEADANVVILCDGGAERACDELRWRLGQNELTILDYNNLPADSTTPDTLADALGAYLTHMPDINLVCITDTVLAADPSHRRSRSSAAALRAVCRARGVPVNVTDMPDLCDFSFASTHRFADPATGTPSALQVGVTTNGQGCRLAARVRREIVARLPREVGGAAAKIAALRAMAKAAEETPVDAPADGEDETNEENGVPTPNRPVPQRAPSETSAECARRQMKYVAQVSEYWPVAQLAALSTVDMAAVLNGLGATTPATDGGGAPRPALHRAGDTELASVHGLVLPAPPRHGRILLVGSGPGHPALLTLATHSALTRHADLVLSDKLVPAAVLALIPAHVEVRIARKFPGNAEGAQREMMEAAVEAAQRGLTVVRLKQGDPTVYGRAGEEVLYFRAHGFEPVVVPGVTSALAAPTAAGIPVTQRGVAESFVVCTGVGRAGRDVRLPGYVRGRTLVVLMGVARLPAVLDALLAPDAGGAGGGERRRAGASFPPHTPIAIVERGTMPDQRVVCSTVRDVATALESSGEQRPPGMIVIGWAVLALHGKGDMTVLDEGGEERDEERVRTWLDGKAWRVTEGLDEGWEGLSI